jgi:hypothetical protein
MVGSGMVKRYNNYIETSLEYAGQTVEYGHHPLKLDVQSNSKGKILYKVEVGDAATINEQTGEINIQKAGTVSLKASQDQWGGYLPAS